MAKKKKPFANVMAAGTGGKVLRGAKFKPELIQRMRDRTFAMKPTEALREVVMVAGESNDEALVKVVRERYLLLVELLKTFESTPDDAAFYESLKA